MTTEDDFLSALRAEPQNEALKLIFADWLEEAGRSSEAEFLRLSCIVIPFPMPRVVGTANPFQRTWLCGLCGGSYIDGVISPDLTCGNPKCRRTAEHYIKSMRRYYDLIQEPGCKKLDQLLTK